VTTVVPEQVAVPLLAVAEVGADEAPVPGYMMINPVPEAIKFAPVSATVAVAVLPLLKPDKVHVWPVVPTAVIPPHAVVMVAAPEQVAVPFPAVAIVGAAVAPVP